MLPIALELRLATHPSDFDSFKSFMKLALKNHGGFGGVWSGKSSRYV